MFNIVGLLLTGVREVRLVSDARDLLPLSQHY